jgi:hypothetical protein
MGTIQHARLRLIGSHTVRTISNSAVAVDVATNANAILMQSADADLRYTLDGTTPVGGTTGFILIAAADKPTFLALPPNCTSLTFIRNAASDGELQYQFLREE